MNSRTTAAAETLWDYMRLGIPAQPADCLLAIGSLREDVATYAAQLVATYDYPTIMISGGSSRIEKTRQLGWGNATEAERYAALMKAAGCDRDDILLEMNAANTGQNATETARLLAAVKLEPETVLVVTKPYMERRVRATFEIQWPEPRPRFFITSLPGRFIDYSTSETEREHTTHVMVGDLQRIIEYPKLGYQSEQHVPHEVKEAMQLLIDEGYTQHLLPLSPRN